MLTILLLTIYIGLPALALLMEISGWLLLKKAGEKGWKILIPWYGSYMVHKIANATRYFWGMWISFISIMVLGAINMQREPSFAGPELFATLLIVLGSWSLLGYMVYCSIRYNNNLAKAFGKGAGFGVGLFFLSVIFFPILALSSRITYQGAGSAQPAPVPVTVGGDVMTAMGPEPTGEIPLAPPVFFDREALLIGKSGPAAGQTYSVTSCSVLGRSAGADICISDGSVSGRHCQLSWRDDKLFLTDLGSSNGTVVDGYGKIPANVNVEMRTGDIIRIGRENVFEVRI